MGFCTYGVRFVCPRQSPAYIRFPKCQPRLSFPSQGASLLPLNPKSPRWHRARTGQACAEQCTLGLAQVEPVHVAALVDPEPKPERLGEQIRVRRRPQPIWQG
jgi:hypothetical protein